MLKARGICVDCKQAQTVQGKACCKECLRFNANRRRLKLQDRKAQGLCLQCGKKTKNSICSRCRPRVRAAKLREMKRRTSEETCRYCRKDPIVPEKTGCRKCLDERADYSRKRNASAEARENNRLKREARHAAKKAAGLCIFCTKPAAPYTKCEEHRATAHQHYHIKQIKKKAAEAKQALLVQQAPAQRA
jgi:hypothetical protein